MGIIADALVGGVGDGMRTYAGQMANNYATDEKYSEQEKLKRMDLDAKRELKMEELKARKDELMMRLAEAREKNRSQFESRPDLYGANATPTDRGRFTKEETTYSRTDDSEYSDAVSRKNAPLVESKKSTFDQAGYDSAEEKRISTNIRRKAMVDHPGQYDSLERGRTQGMVNGLIGNAMSETDQTAREEAFKDAGAAAIAGKGGSRYQVRGNTVYDTLTGEDRATDVGDSIIDKNTTPRPGVAKPDTEAGKNARASVSTAERVLRSAEQNLSKLSESPVINKDRIAKQEAYVRQLRDELATARQALATPAAAGDPATRSSAAPAAAASRVTPAAQAGKDAEAGRLMIENEFGGSVERAKSELSAMREGIKRAPAGDARSMLEGQANRLESGIRAVEGKTSQGDNSGVAAPASKAEYDRLPKGSRYRAPDGSIRIKG